MARLVFLALFVALTPARAAAPGFAELLDPYNASFAAQANPLRARQQAFSTLLAAEGPAAAIRALPKLTPALAAIQKRIDKAWAHYQAMGKKYYGWIEQHRKQTLKKTGREPAGYKVPEGINKPFLAAEIAFKKTVAYRNRAHMLHYWMQGELHKACAKPIDQGPGKKVRAALLAGLKNRDVDVRRRCALLAGVCADQSLAGVLCKQALTDKCAAVGGLMLEAGARRRAPYAPAAIKSGLFHAAWPLRAGAIRAAAAYGGGEIARLLAARLPVEAGRLRDDCLHALRALANQDLGTDAPAWQKWAQEVAADLPSVAAPPFQPPFEKAAANAVPGVGSLSWFDVASSSRAVVFCVDMPGRLAEVIIPELEAALATVPDGAQFGLVLTGPEPRRFKKKLTKMSAAVRSGVAKFLRKAAAASASKTSLHAAYLAALQIAGGSAKKAPTADTIYLLALRPGAADPYANEDRVAWEVVARTRMLGIRVHAIGTGGGRASYWLQRIAAPFQGTARVFG